MKIKILSLFVLVLSVITVSSCNSVEFPIDDETTVAPVEEQQQTDIASDTEAETQEPIAEASEAEDELIGVWWCDNYGNHGEDEPGISHELSFSKIDGSYIGAYTVDTNIPYSERVEREFTVFEYRFNGEMLEFVADNTVIQTDVCSLNGDTLIYGDREYTKTDYPNIRALPNQDDYNYLFTSALGLDVICEGDLTNVFIMSSTGGIDRGSPEKYCTIDISADGIKELLIQYTNLDVALLEWSYGQWLASFDAYEGIDESNIIWKDIPEITDFREGKANIEI